MKNSSIKIWIIILLCTCGRLFGQHRTENLVIITLDGFRWQEMFGGIDSTLTETKKFNGNAQALYRDFGAATPAERRVRLLPFFWNTVMKQGQIWGNRSLGNDVDVANPHKFSYPGYSEIFTGLPDPAVNSNDKILNPHVNLLEFLNRQKKYRGKVAAFTSWDVFPYILNEPRAGFPVNSGIEDVTGKISQAQAALNEMQHFQTPYLGDVRLDFVTFQMAKEYVRQNHPRVLYIGFDETDDLAHEGHYDLYAHAAHQTDAAIASLWQYLQSEPQYRDKTTLFITCDHGRGDDGRGGWRSHGADVQGAEHIWFAVLGPDTPASGEMKTTGQWYQKQFAATMARLLGEEFKPEHPVGAPIMEVMKK